MVTFNLKRGDTWRQTFHWRQGSESGAAVDFTGCLARVQLRDKLKNLILDVTPYLTLDGANGSVEINVPASDTGLFPLEALNFDIEITFPDGTVQSTETMKLKIVEDITL